MFKATRKDVENTFTKVVKVGYCDLAYLLPETGKIAYNSGVYGWNWHCYRLSNNVAVVTGYRNLFGKRCPREVEFEERARAILDYNVDIDWKQREKMMEDLRREFIEYCEKTYREWK